ncbi:helix-turn-helix transcriptional regulator [Streptomyces sp. AM 4-1-1]|uniref:helix-turn-helix domain-containing protein n=1 Tax=Streptomyces sp. AM 4-1-1 TaxID=3028710 RepID=UPI0023B8CD64|nr:helix-turn-helix transcriptional regulator [Streptomyces sp. AM 4-1-1]WEH33497.1 helix-turn-helix transcriptional regulator [Streptomyces sp. AM 4-1-1]
MSSTYGEWIREQRVAAGLTQQDLADAAIMTRSHISHIEAGRRVPSQDDARRLDKALNTGNVLSRFRPQDDVAVADYFEAGRQLEQQATTIREFALSYVPGILQTEAYAQAVLRIAYPPRGTEERDRLVVSRIERARILDDPLTPVVSVLLDEAVLRRPIGGSTVMADQITSMIHLVERERVRIHVLPFGLGGHPLLLGMMTLMWFEDQPPAVYSEGAFMGTVHDSPGLVQRIQGTYDLALGDALPLKESVAFMRTIAKEYGHHD